MEEKQSGMQRFRRALVKLLCPSRPGYVTVYKPLGRNEEYSTSLGITEAHNTMEKKDYISFDTSKSELIKEITISGIEMQIVLNESVINERCKDTAKGDDYYRDITLYMKDGSSFDIVKDYKTADFCYGNHSAPNGENIYRSYIFLHAIAFDEIVYLKMDGMRFFPE